MTKLLIVDDNEQNLSLLQILLNSYGYEVVLASNGVEALEKARRDPPDIIITDILMPVMDGFALCREWKQDNRLKDIPFVFYTATYTNSEDKEFALKLGADRFILKPVEADVFIGLLREVIEDYKIRRSVMSRGQMEEKIFYKNYNQALIRKLEDKMVNLEDLNQTLEREIIERKRVEQALHKINRTLRALTECNQVVVRATDESTLLHDICRIIVNVGGYRLAWVGFAEQDDTKTVRPVAHVGFEEGYLDTMNITWADNERGHGPTGTAIRTRKPSICRSILTDPKYAPWRSEAVKRGYESSIALPLIANGQTLGALNIYAIEPDAFDMEEVKLLTELANDLAFGLVTLRTRVERQQTQEVLQQRFQEMSVLNTIGHQVSTTLSMDQVVRTALDGIVASTNPDLTMLYLREGDRLLLQGVGPKDPQFYHKETPVHHVGECLCGLAVSKGKPIYSKNIHSDPRCTWEECKKAGLRSFAALPLRSGEEIIGVLGLASRAERDFGEQVTFLETLSNEIAIGLRNALLYEQVRRHSVELEQCVAKRTAKLEAANKELEDFSYSVSHDLRAPLRAIRGFAEIIARRHRASLNEEGQHYFDNIVEASDQMDRLINDLLTYSRLGRQAVRRQPVPLHDLFTQVINNLKDRVAEIGAYLSLPDDLPILSSNWTLLSQIFTNLLGNTLTYRRKDIPLQVEVTCQLEADHVIICVTDNGIGIAPEFQKKIFNIFQRLHSQDEYPGTGIGLATAKKSVELLGGQIWVESEPGEGSTFFVQFPISKEEL